MKDEKGAVVGLPTGNGAGEVEALCRMIYRCYIDESGNADLGSADNPEQRFLCLTGIIMDLDHVADIVHPELEKLKREFFRHHPDEPVVLHRKELVNRNHPFDSLRDEIKRNLFWDSMVGLLSSWDYTAIAVCIDKKSHKETYSVWRYEPYHYCLAVLMERYAFFLRQKRSLGDVMAESRGDKSDMRLKKSYNGLWRSGTEYVSAENLQKALSSRELKVKPKRDNIARLQIADMLSQATRDDILERNGLLGKESNPLNRRLVAVLEDKYYRRGGNVYGRKLLGGK
jgi:hypothetical protein